MTKTTDCESERKKRSGRMMEVHVSSGGGGGGGGGEENDRNETEIKIESDRYD